MRGRRANRALVHLTALAAAALALFAASAQAAETPLRLAEGGGPPFPARALIVSVPGRSAIGATQVHVSENGRPVGGAVVTPIAQANAGDFGIVLAIDLAPSMRGAPLERAMAAARTLAAQRSGMQELGVVVFDQSARVLLPLTDSAVAIERALAHTPRTGSGAYIYNALQVSLAQLADAKIASGAVILLSDGASEGARPVPGHYVSARAIGAAAVSAHAQIYTVGLRDGSYTPQRMSLLAQVGGGAFVEASSTQLASVFERIDAGLTSAYVIHYRSRAPLGAHVTVAVSVDGVAAPATLSYTTPPRPQASGRRHPGSPGKSFWVSSLAAALFTGIAALLLGLAVYIYLGPRLRRSGLRRRVGEFTTTGSPEEVEPAGSTGEASSRLERRLQRTRWYPAFATDVEIARMSRPADELVVITGAVTLSAAALLTLLTGLAVLGILMLLAGPALLRTIVRRRLEKQRDRFAEQLPSHLQELASTMRAGHSLVAGINEMAREAPEPSHTEWERVVADEQLGIPLDEAMKTLAVRMASTDIEQVALVAALHQRTGGNMAEVLERVADSVRERAELRRELEALTAQARLSRYVVTALPIVVASAIAVINPGYLEPLFNTSTGITLVFIAVGLLVAASFVMRKITDIKV